MNGIGVHSTSASGRFMSAIGTNSRAATNPMPNAGRTANTKPANPGTPAARARRRAVRVVAAGARAGGAHDDEPDGLDAGAHEQVAHPLELLALGVVGPHDDDDVVHVRHQPERVADLAER